MDQETVNQLKQISMETFQTHSMNLLSKFSDMLLQNNTNVMEHFDSALKESRSEFKLMIDLAIEKIEIEGMKWIGEADKKVAERIHFIVNGKFEKILMRLDTLDNKNEQLFGLKQELRKNSVPLYFKHLFFTHPFKFISGIVLFVIANIFVLSRVFQFPISSWELLTFAIMKRVLHLE